MSEQRKFIRHPTEIPLMISVGMPSLDGAPAQAHDVSLGGISFNYGRCLETGSLVEVNIPSVRPPFATQARVAWCREEDGNFEVGVQFIEAQSAFKARMVEQVCHIEAYKKQVREKDGRELTSAEAASEWIASHAASFPSTSD